MRKSLAGPLAALYAGLIAYASLYPFGPWRDPGVSPWGYLTAWPVYWSRFDVVANLLGYAPMGFVLTLWLPPRWRGVTAFALATGLSLSLEALQTYLPQRVPSSLDAMLNGTGAALGAVLAVHALRRGWVHRWSAWRDAWFAPDARGALVLLALWPMALLFPTPRPFSLGHVMSRLQTWLQMTWGESAWPWGGELLHAPTASLTPLGEGAVVVLAVLLPVLLAYGAIARAPLRLAAATWVMGVGVLTLALSTALSHGPAHAWAWWQPSVQGALVVAWVAAALLVGLNRRAVWALVVVVAVAYLGLINQAGLDPYVEHNLTLWEQGRFIRFHGVAQWLGWAWPYALLAYALLTLGWRKQN